MAFQECSKWAEFWQKTFEAGFGKVIMSFCLFFLTHTLDWNCYFAEKADGRDGLALIYEKER